MKNVVVEGKVLCGSGAVLQGPHMMLPVPHVPSIHQVQVKAPGVPDSAALARAL